MTENEIKELRRLSIWLRGLASLEDGARRTELFKRADLCKKAAGYIEDGERDLQHTKEELEYAKQNFGRTDDFYKFGPGG